MLDYFEMDRVIEELAKAYPAQCATTWFKIIKNHKPTKEEYRDKVVEYMKQFEYLLATYPQSLETEKLKELVKKSLGNEIEKVPYKEGTLIIDLINRKSGKVVWRGYAQGEVNNPQSAINDLPKIVDGIFSKLTMRKVS